MDEIKKILLEGTDAQKRYLFEFDGSTDLETTYKKFQYFTRYNFPKFFKSKDAPFHREMVLNFIDLYRGKGVDNEFLNIGFRGCSKTTFRKLFKVFVITCDTEHRRKYHKFLSADSQNSVQFVTDIYNMLISKRLNQLFPETFEKTTAKREETMSSFTTSYGVKLRAGTIGQSQRGNVQGEEDATRPDDLDFDDVESRDTLRSAVKTRRIWDNMQEAVNGLDHSGTTCYSANYISERGNVHLLVQRVKNKMIIPIQDEEGNPTWDRFSLKDIESIKSKADDFEGEYLCKPSASKDVLFDRESIDKQIAKKPIRESAGLKVFKEFTASHRTAGGMDVALGVGLDSSTSVFIDFDTIPAQVIGTYYNNQIRPKEFGDEIVREARIFGECYVAPEKNNAGISTIDRLKEIYPMQRIHTTQRKLQGIQYAIPNEFGWDTNGDTKSRMFNDLSQAVESGWIDLNDEDLIREAKSYTRNDIMDKEVDPRLVTRHFDLLTACAIAWQMKEFAMRSSQKEQPNTIDNLFKKNHETNVVNRFD